MRANAFLTVLYAFTGTLLVQQFDVVSIREVPPNTPPTFRTQDFTPVLPGGQYVDERTALMFMIAFAYDVKDPSRTLRGLPNWANNVSYAVAAKAAEGNPELSPAENRERVRAMLRVMLEDRFRLKLHTETKQEQVLQLVPARGGIKIKEVAAPVPPEKEGVVNAAMGDSGGRMLTTKGTMAGLARALNIFLPLPVVDQTGSHAFYDFDIRWKSPDPTAAQGLGVGGQGLLISNLEEQLGVRLVKSTGSITYWVVDSVQKPSEN